MKMSTYSIIHERDSLGGVYEEPQVISEHDSLDAAIHAQLGSGSGHVVHNASGLQLHAVPHDGGPDMIWLDSSGVQHDPPNA
jgi:hypothetical protein